MSRTRICMLMRLGGFHSSHSEAPPLLEVDPPSVNDGSLEQKSSLRPLELEPLLLQELPLKMAYVFFLMLMTLIASSGQPQDGSSQLRRRRQVLLKGYASLQLVDPLGPDKASRSFGLIPKDDLVFLHSISPPRVVSFCHTFVFYILEVNLPALSA
ncbi:hypothetical protein HPP92_000909 [Vanilla planifolia]|uniref:Uncharacterized protein n=1 Tax=Vanilla planifolia TaxID=51239 RepID=A0A835S2C0_VANPL|nr:hypothetical protein HPP92_000909 [Vanilla planifolia]